ncbi:MAG: ABC transporter permease [Firmicutes bacterium]|nr:ABC transporter permease [Bacillota bacterium]
MNPTHSLGFAGVPVGILIDQEAAKLTRRYREEGRHSLVQPPWFSDSVRVRVSGVEDMSEQSQVRIMTIAQQIRDATGLHVDVVLGSSRSQVPVTLQDYDSDGRQEYRQQIEAQMDDFADRLAAEAGERLTWSFTSYSVSGPTRMGLILSTGRTPDTGPDMNRLEYTAPLLWPLVTDSEERSYNRELRAILDTYVEEIKETPGIVYTERDGTVSTSDGVVHFSVPDYHIPEHEERTLFGVVQEQWIQMGTALRIHHETNRGTFWITVGLLVVSALFIGNTTFISTIGRTNEFSTLRALGWRRNTVFGVSFLETMTIALVAGAITALITALVWLLSARYLEPWLLMIVAPAVFVTFILGSLPPLVRMLFVPILQGSTRGELKTNTRIGGPRPLGFVIRSLITRPGRTLITVFALAVPGAYWPLCSMCLPVFRACWERRCWANTWLWNFGAITCC